MEASREPVARVRGLVNSRIASASGIAAHFWFALRLLKFVLNPNFGSLHQESIFFASLSEVGFDPVTSTFKNR